jgi:hypothetical protein
MYIYFARLDESNGDTFGKYRSFVTANMGTIKFLQVIYQDHQLLIVRRVAQGTGLPVNLLIAERMPNLSNNEPCGQNGDCP